MISLCEISNVSGSALVDFAVAWVVLTVMGALSIFGMSGSVFWAYYWAPTFQQWQRKLNPEFPTASKVKLEIVQTSKSLMSATLCPALVSILTHPFLPSHFAVLLLPYLAFTSYPPILLCSVLFALPGARTQPVPRTGRAEGGAMVALLAQGAGLLRPCPARGHPHPLGAQPGAVPCCAVCSVLGGVRPV